MLHSGRKNPVRSFFFSSHKKKDRSPPFPGPASGPFLLAEKRIFYLIRFRNSAWISSLMISLAVSEE